MILDRDTLERTNTRQTRDIKPEGFSHTVRLRELSAKDTYDYLAAMSSIDLSEDGSVRPQQFPEFARIQLDFIGRSVIDEQGEQVCADGSLFNNLDRAVLDEIFSEISKLNGFSDSEEDVKKKQS